MKYNYKIKRVRPGAWYLYDDKGPTMFHSFALMFYYMARKEAGK